MRHLIKHTPRTVAEVCNISGVVMAVLILLAPNPRVGYLVYPVNLFVWAYLLAEPAAARKRGRSRPARRRARPERRQRGLSPRPITYSGSGSWSRRTVKSVAPAAGAPLPNEVACTVTPISQ